MKPKAFTWILFAVLPVSFFLSPSVVACQSEKGVLEQALAFTQRGWELFQEGKYREAVKLFDMAILYNPNDKHAYEMRNCCYREEILRNRSIITTLHRRISINREQIEQLQGEASRNREAAESLGFAVLASQGLAFQLQEEIAKHDEMINVLRCELSENKESAEQFRDAFAENREILLELKAQLLDTRGIQDVLIKYGNNSDGLPALHAAIKNSDISSVRLLVEHGADVNAQAVILDVFGTNSPKLPLKCTALHLAMLLNEVEIVRFLRSRGADEIKIEKVDIDQQRLNNVLIEAAAKKENPVVLALQQFDFQMAEYLLQMRNMDIDAGRTTFDFPGYNFSRIYIPGHSQYGHPLPALYKPVLIEIVNNWGVVESRYESRIDLELISFLMKYDRAKEYRNHFDTIYGYAYSYCDLEVLLFLEKVRKSERIGVNTPRASRFIDVFSGSVPFNQANKQHFFDGRGNPPGTIFEFRNDDNEKVRELKKQYRALIGV
ncbi:MAG: ankyrin repeat domain-containing protein [Chlamydiota bacterium]